MPGVEVVEADLARVEDQHAVVELLDAYSRDPMGNGQPLAAETKRELIPGLREHPTTLVFLAYIDGRPVGLAVCFRGFSTFAARPLINIHDLTVVPEQRGLGADPPGGRGRPRLGRGHRQGTVPRRRRPAGVRRRLLGRRAAPGRGRRRRRQPRRAVRDGNLAEGRDVPRPPGRYAVTGLRAGPPQAGFRRWRKTTGKRR